MRLHHKKQFPCDQLWSVDSLRYILNRKKFGRGFYFHLDNFEPLPHFDKIFTGSHITVVFSVRENKKNHNRNFVINIKVTLLDNHVSRDIRSKLVDCLYFSLSRNTYR